MSLLDNDYLFDKMNEVKLVGGHADDENVKQTAPGPQTLPYDLESALQKLDTMYQYRNDEIRDKDSNDEEIRNMCEAHVYTSFEDYQKKKNRYFSISLGDINDALDDMAYCTCNSRQKPGCDCVARTSGDNCQCHVRYVYQCDCVSRSGSKYRPYCYCHTRLAYCNCVSRTPSVSCSCNARCSCNIVNEYSNEEPVSRECQCVSRTLNETHCECNGRTPTYDKNKSEDWTPPACTCNARTYDTCTFNYDSRTGKQQPYIYRCTCVSRGTSCNYVDASNGCYCVARQNSCWCYMRTAQEYEHGECKCVSRKSEEFCDINVIR